MPRRGLPQNMKMRHDEHYVETLAASSGAPVGRLVSIAQVDPTPNQPRSFCIDRSSRFLYSAGTDTSTLFAYRIAPKRGSLEKFATYETGTLPAWVLCLESPN